MILLGQIYYYRRKNKQHTPSLAADVSIPQGPDSENTPLLATSNSNGHEQKIPSLAKQFIKYAAAVLFVLMTGVAAWGVDQYIHRGQPRTRPEEVVEWRSQLLGWISAVMFRAYAFSQRSYSEADNERSWCSCSSNTWVSSI